jgi:hypothetical protein
MFCENCSLYVVKKRKSDIAQLGYGVVYSVCGVAQLGYGVGKL